MDDVFVGVLDSKVDIDHPAWLDCDLAGCSASRLTDQWAYDTGWYSDTVGTTGGANHGTLVAGQLIADLTDGQDNTVSPSERAAHTGMTTEASFAAIDKNSPSRVDDAMEFVPLLGLDIANMSFGCSGCDACDPEHDRNLYVNSIYHDGVFVVHAPYNDGHEGTECTAVVPVAAAGNFAVGALEYDAADLFSGDLRTGSPRGGGEEGQPLMDLVAVGGRSGNGLPIYDDTYDTAGHGGTSYAAPVVAGGAANLKHLLLELFSASTANSVGLIHAQMLLMGDGQLESGGSSFGGNGDELWGFGRLRMRMWNAAGMDAPWRVRLVSWTLSDGEATSLPFHPNGAFNQDIPLGVDHAKAVVWWYEPNLNYASNDPASVRTQVCNEYTSTCTIGAVTDPDAHRRSRGSEIVGDPWSIKVTGLDIPANADPDDHYG